MGKGNSSNMRADPGRLTCTNLPMKTYLISAWALKDYELSAPEWMNEERFDITATMTAGTPAGDVLAMLQGLLTDRFRMAAHKETKELPVYALVVDKSGIKLKPAEGFGGTSISSNPKGRTMHANVSMKSFAGSLSRFLDKPVIDMTGLTGGFKIDLEWALDDADALGPTIFTALHEVGLKLESRKAPVEILVVDHAEKFPVEN